MAGSRKDSHGYVLHTGEYHKKDGRYVYAYSDYKHVRHYVYAKSLLELREKEKNIFRDELDGLKPGAASKLTLNQVYDSYMNLRKDLRSTTRASYLYMYNHFVRNEIGTRKIQTLNYSTIKKFYIDLLLKTDMRITTLENIHNQIHPALQLAVKDDILRKNPADGILGELKRSNINPGSPRHSFTVEEQKAFVKCLKEENELYFYSPIIMILLGTGMRMAECIGLRWCDIDMEKRLIDVNHVLNIKMMENGKFERHIDSPKTVAGVRIIPMLDEVYDAFCTQAGFKNMFGGCEEEIEGYRDFVFFQPNHRVCAPDAVNRYIKHTIRLCNEKEILIAEKENRDPNLLPEISAHSLRHTFCTRFCENETNDKIIQSVMGHADIETTLDRYAEATMDKKKEIINKLNGKIFVADE